MPALSKPLRMDFDWAGVILGAQRRLINTDVGVRSVKLPSRSGI